MDIRTKVGLRIKELRQHRHLSQEKLAHLADIDRTYITSVENGHRNISIVNLERICVALKVDIAHFFRNIT
jgi:transcriptional regulator with XRE-family HTH domain